MRLIIDSLRGKQAFNDGLQLAADWLKASRIKIAPETTPLAFVQRQVTQVPRLQCPRQAFRLFCTNSQNKSGAANLLSATNWDNLGKFVLYDYNYTEIVRNYPISRGIASLCAAVVRAHGKGTPILNGREAVHLAALADPAENQNAAWMKLLCVVQEGANRFQNLTGEIGHTANPIDVLVGPIAQKAVAAVTMQDIEQTLARFRMKHIGPALAANFLKDLGHIEHFFKPDTHTCKVAGRAFLASGADFPDTEPLAVMEHALVFSKATGIPLAHLDRIMWLAGSGRYLGPTTPGGPWQQVLLLHDAGRDARITAMAEVFRKAVTRPSTWS